MHQLSAVFVNHKDSSAKACIFAGITPLQSKEDYKDAQLQELTLNCCITLSKVSWSNEDLNRKPTNSILCTNNGTVPSSNELGTVPF